MNTFLIKYQAYFIVSFRKEKSTQLGSATGILREAIGAKPRMNYLRAKVLNMLCFHQHKLANVFMHIKYLKVRTYGLTILLPYAL